MFHKLWDKIKQLGLVIDHDIMGMIHFAAIIFGNKEIAAAISYVRGAEQTYVPKLVDGVVSEVEKAVANTDRREWVVGMLVKSHLMDENRARILAEMATAWVKHEADKGATGFIDAVLEHFIAAAV